MFHALARRSARGPSSPWPWPPAAGRRLPTRIYENKLTRLADPKPLLADHPDFVAPVRERRGTRRPLLVEDAGADLDVRAWRFSYNARGIIEMPNRLRAAETAVIMVHPWGIDDGQGWATPEPAGVVRLLHPGQERPRRPAHPRGRSTRSSRALRGKAALRHVQPDRRRGPDPQEALPSSDGRPTEEERKAGREGTGREAEGVQVRAEPLPEKLTLSKDRPVDRLLQAVPRAGRRAEVQRGRVLGPAGAGHEGRRRRPGRRGDLRPAGVRRRSGTS